MQLINTQLIKHPVNWLTIIMMLVIAAIAGHLTLSLFDVEPAS